MRARQPGTVSRRQIDLACRSFAHSPAHAIVQKGPRSVHFNKLTVGRSYGRSRPKSEFPLIFVHSFPNWNRVRKNVRRNPRLALLGGSPAFMRGKERLSAPGKARLQSMRFSAGIAKSQG